MHYEFKVLLLRHTKTLEFFLFTYLLSKETEVPRIEITSSMILQSTIEERHESSLSILEALMMLDYSYNLNILRH